MSVVGHAGEFIVKKLDNKSKDMLPSQINFLMFETYILKLKTQATKSNERQPFKSSNTKCVNKKLSQIPQQNRMYRFLGQWTKTNETINHEPSIIRHPEEMN